MQRVIPEHDSFYTTYLAFLVAIGEDLQAVCGDGEELDVVPLEQGDHLL